MSRDADDLRLNSQSELIAEWRRLRRAATIVALLTSPAAMLWWYYEANLDVAVSVALGLLTVIIFRGFIDVVLRRLLPWPTMFGATPEVIEEDVLARRRSWYWRRKLRRWAWIVATFGTIFLIIHVATGNSSFGDTLDDIGDGFMEFLPMIAGYALIIPILFLANFLILFGPLLFFGVKQIKGYEPGDADWGVKLGDIRGQKEAKEEVGRVIQLWQSGDEFEKSGGKRERGLLFIGAPGTGKTMLAKGIATNFNCPFVTVPGSAFAQTFIGMDVAIVMYLTWRAKKLAKKWGGQCIIFIDEIDAVGMRRAALGGEIGSASTPMPKSIEDVAFYGETGAYTPDGELVLETAAWREKIFAQRARAQKTPVYPEAFLRLGENINKFMVPGMMGGGSLALNQLLVQMDGIDEPPMMKRFFTKRINMLLDASYIIPSKVGKVSFRLPRPKPASEQIFFIGATNVPIGQLDPALIRPGRMGRHIWFRTPNKDDRKDVFDLYIGKVAHVEDLDTEQRRDEIARMTIGYSPAMIEQVCSMALTYAHSDARRRFEWKDLVEAMTTVESGTAVAVEYVPEETRAVAIHEAGHAVTGHLYMKGTLSTRLSIKRRGDSLGHHQAIETEERFSRWHHEEFARVVWALGAMAAERVFYGENSAGVSGDVHSATISAALMVGVWGMAPEPIDLSDHPDFAGANGKADEKQQEIEDRFVKIGTQIMHRAQHGSMFSGDPLAGILGDRDKRRSAAGLLGQAYVTAALIIDQNKDGVAKVAEELVERREMHGDEVVELLDGVGLHLPEFNPLDESAWPKA